MSSIIDKSIDEHLFAIENIRKVKAELQLCAEKIVETSRKNRTVYLCGNGGSAADCQHFAAELTGRFERERRGYPAVSLTTDTSALTAIGNDYGFDRVFSRQLESVSRSNDMLICFSTSGNSQNIVLASKIARENGMFTAAFLGRDGGQLRDLVDLPIIVPSHRTARIQECHILMVHLICELIDDVAPGGDFA